MIIASSTVLRTPLSAAERRFWELSRSGQKSMELGWPNALRMRGELDVTALQRAWRHLVARHDILRTRFPAAVDGSAKRMVATPSDGAAATATVPTTDLRGLTAPAVAAAVGAAVRAETAAVQEVATGPLVAARLLRLPDSPDGAPVHLLVVTGHSIALDNWSVGLLWRDIGALYQAEAAGVPDGLPPVRTSCAEHAARQAADLAFRAAADPAALTAVARRRAAHRPTRLPRPARDGRAAGAGQIVAPVTVPAAALRALRARLAVGPVTDFVLLLSAFAEAVADVVGHDEITLGTASAGRGPDVFETVGYFTNRLVVGVDRRGRQGPADFACTVRAVREALFTELAAADLPFEYLLAELHPDHYTAPAPLVDLMFVLADGQEPATFGDLAATVEPVAPPLDRFGLLLFARPVADGYVVTAHQQEARAERRAVEAVIGRFTTLLLKDGADAVGRPRAGRS